MTNTHERPKVAMIATGNGGGYDLAEAGAIFGGDLSGQKARILLMLALARGGRQGFRELLEPHLEL